MYVHGFKYIVLDGFSWNELLWVLVYSDVFCWTAGSLALQQVEIAPKLVQIVAFSLCFGDL